MKKLSFLALAAVTLVACGENKPTPEDFATIEKEIQQATLNNPMLSISAVGPAGDYIVNLPATDALVTIAAKEKSAAFLSVENAGQFVEEGKCILNIIPQKTMENMNTPENNCNFRLFCGTADEMEAEFYAVEVCSE